MKTAEQLVADIEARVRPTICNTFGMRDGEPHESIEGRISQVDLDTIVRLFRDAGKRAREAERERCAMLHESVRTHCDHEPGAGAGAMGAVIQYRDLIRSPQAHQLGRPQHAARHGRCIGQQTLHRGGRRRGETRVHRVLGFILRRLSA